MTGGDKVKLKAAGFRVFYQNRDKKKIYESVYGTVRTYAALTRREKRGADAKQH